MRQKYSNRKFLAHDPLLIIAGNGVSAVEAAQTAAQKGIQTMLISGHLDWLAAEACGLEIDEVTAADPIFYDTHFAILALESMQEMRGCHEDLVFLDELLLRKHAKERLENTQNLSLRQSVIESVVRKKNRLFLKTIFEEEFLCDGLLIELGESRVNCDLLASISKLGVRLTERTSSTEMIIDGKTMHGLKLEPIELLKSGYSLARFLSDEYPGVIFSPVSPGFELRISGGKPVNHAEIMAGRKVLKHNRTFREERPGKRSTPKNKEAPIMLLNPPEAGTPILETLNSARESVFETGKAMGCFT